MIEKDLFATLKNVCDRVYPIKMPQDASYPAITYMVIADINEQSLYGNVFMNSIRFQVDIFAKSYSEVKGLKDEVIEKIVELRGCDISVQDLYEDDIELYRELLDFKIRR